MRPESEYDKTVATTLAVIVIHEGEKNATLQSQKNGGSQCQ